MPENLPNDATNPVASAETVPAAPAAAPASTEAKPAEQNPAANPEAKPAEKPAEAAPEEYADFKAPEGVVLDPGVVGEFKTLAKELNLPQDKAQTVIDRLTPKIAQAQEAAFNAAVTETRKSWVEAAKADKEFGGAEFDKNLAGAKGVLDKFGTPEFVAFLKDTGLGDNPEMIRIFARISKAVSEDAIHTGKPASETSRTGFVYSKSSNFK